VGKEQQGKMAMVDLVILQQFYMTALSRHAWATGGGPEQTRKSEAAMAVRTWDRSYSPSPF